MARAKDQERSTQPLARLAARWDRPSLSAMNFALWFALIPLSALAFTGAWLIQRRTGDAGVVDVFWPYAVAAAAALLALFGSGDEGRRWLMAILALAWGLRLGTYILTDRIIAGHEDRRYAQMRVDWGDRFQLFIFRFYQYQAISVFGLALVFVIIAANEAPLGLWGWLSGLVVLTGIVGETLADQQLKSWRMDPLNKGKTCRGGLWSYSRHPNYFFEWLVWMGWALMAITTAGWGIFGLIPAIILYVAINYFTGIPPNEEQNVRSRGDDYRTYQNQVSAFWPWFPKA